MKLIIFCLLKKIYTVDQIVCLYLIVDFIYNLYAFNKSLILLRILNAKLVTAHFGWW